MVTQSCHHEGAVFCENIFINSCKLGIHKNGGAQKREHDEHFLRNHDARNRFKITLYKFVLGRKKGCFNGCVR
jgi:hypothetical protein